jgi:hypothetical protein
MFLAAEFLDQEGLVRALRNLKSEGCGSDEIAVFSDEPIEFPRDALHRPSHMSFIVVMGAITLCLLTIGFVYYTQYDYPIITGGMPTFSFWATGVIFYELTMLGAIVTTFLWFIRESGLLRRGPRKPAPTIEPGVIALRIECESNRSDGLSHLLRSAGAVNIRTLEAAR